MRYFIPIEELIQLEIQRIKRLIKLNRDVVCITRWDDWKQMFKDTEPIGCDYGEMVKWHDYFFINIEKIETWRQVVNTIAHELLHMKYPSATERQIEKLARQYTNKDHDT